MAQGTVMCFVLDLRSQSSSHQPADVFSELMDLCPNECRQTILSFPHLHISATSFMSSGHLAERFTSFIISSHVVSTFLYLSFCSKNYYLKPVLVLLKLNYCYYKHSLKPMSVLILIPNYLITIAPILSSMTGTIAPLVC